MQEAGSDVPAECLDFSGRRVLIEPGVVEHIRARHPEMTQYLGLIGDVLLSPDFVYLRGRTNTRLYYKLGILTGKLANTYMVVIVRYNDPSTGEVRTTYPTTQPASGDVLAYVRPTRGRL